MQNNPIKNNLAARKASAEMLLDAYNGKTSSVIASALAEAWQQGEHELVRDTLRRAVSAIQQEQWLKDTKARLVNDRMRLAFDLYMQGALTW